MGAQMTYALIVVAWLIALFVRVVYPDAALGVEIVSLAAFVGLPIAFVVLLWRRRSKGPQNVEPDRAEANRPALAQFEVHLD
jgi:hypothetical protein